jgi:NADH-quinone oxidoreductase subunit A
MMIIWQGMVDLMIYPLLEIIEKVYRYTIHSIITAYNHTYNKDNIIYYQNSYNSFFFYMLLIFIICVLILVLAYILSGNNLYYEKASGYECGFDPFSDAREPFYVKFYLISILFIIFDVEIVFFFPFIISLLYINYYGLYIMYIFLVILTIGFAYEWKKGSLEWE